MSNMRKISFYSLHISNNAVEPYSPFEIRLHSGWTDGTYNYYYDRGRKHKSNHSMSHKKWCAVDPASGAALAFEETLDKVRTLAHSELIQRKLSSTVKEDRYADMVAMFAQMRAEREGEKE